MKSKVDLKEPSLNSVARVWMRALRLTLLLGFIFIGLFSLTLGLARADSSNPSISVGDHWTYNYSTLSAGLNLTGTLKQTIVAAETVIVQGSSYDVYKLTDDASGYVTGGAITGSWMITGTELHQRSDLAGISGTVTIELVANGVTAMVTVSSEDSPAQQTLSFPLYVAKTWTQTITEKTNITTTVTSPFNPPQQHTVTTTNTTTTTYAVIDNPIVKVDAGSFDTYEIRSSDKRSVSLGYYSPQANLFVKQVSANATTGQVTTKLSLKEYSSWPYKTKYNLATAGQTVLIQTDVPQSNFSQNTTTLTFQVSGREGTSGRVSITIPKQVNSTDLVIYIDNQRSSSTNTNTADNYTISLSLSYSTHTITLYYSKPVAGFFTSLLQPPLDYIVFGGIAAVIIVILTSILVTRRRAKQGFEIAPPTPTEAPPPPPPAPSTLLGHGQVKLHNLRS